MSCKTEPRFKSYDEFTEKEKTTFGELYKEILKENNKRNNIFGHLTDMGKYGYELLIGYPYECMGVSIRTRDTSDETYDVVFKVNKSRKIEKSEKPKSLESYELKMSDNLYWKMIDFLENIILPQSGFERRENALAMRKRVQNQIHGKVTGGKRRHTRRYKLTVRRKKNTRRNRI
jgi:hypothetical protein